MSIFQTPEWEKFKLETGWQKSHRIDDNVLVLQKNLPMGRTMLYSPMTKKTIRLLDQIKQIAKDSNAIFYRLEINEAKRDEVVGNLKKLGFIKSFEEMQPEHTQIINISQNEEEILSQMKQKGRYNIKVAKKHNVKVTQSDTIDNFYDLYEAMAKRQKISYRSKQYFQKLLNILKKKEHIKVFEARSNEKVLASAVISYYKGRATYLFGGSSQEERNVMAPYLLHWEIMKDAKTKGFFEYDLFGIAPENQPKHAWAGVTSFKKKLGGNYVELIGSYDLVFKSLEYKIFTLAERLRR